MSRRHSSSEEEDAEINITPMLDIVFIMLIFFIVTTSFIKETGIEPNRPEAETRDETTASMLIAISKTDQIWMNKNPVEISQVRTMVEAGRAENPEGGVVIIADEEATSGLLIDVMDQVRLGGVSDIAVAADEI